MDLPRGFSIVMPGAAVHVVCDRCKARFGYPYRNEPMEDWAREHLCALLPASERRGYVIGMTQKIAVVVLSHQNGTQVAREFGGPTGVGNAVVQHWSDIVNDAAANGWELFELYRGSDGKPVELVFSKSV